MRREADSVRGAVPAAESVEAQLEKILASKSFSHSERMCRFLRFAVEETLKGREDTLKEYRIGVEVFDRPDSYDPRIDPIVRVEAGRLRAKLEEYYREEGRNDPVFIGLQKGSYVPLIQPASLATAGRARSWRDPKTIALLAPVLLAAAALSWAAVLLRENRALRKDLEAVKPELTREVALVWGPFLAGGVKNYVVFGSPVFHAAEREGLFLRWSGQKDPAKMGQRFGPLSGPRYDYASMGDAIALQQLTAFFGRAGGSLIALPAHLANWDALQDGNIIFLGAPRMIPLIERLPVRQDFGWDAEHNVVNRNPLSGELAKYVTASHYDEVSYAIIACFPGLQTERRILMLTAHSAPGVRSAVDYMTRLENLRWLMAKLGASTRYYQILLRVAVDKGARVKSEYVTHHAKPVTETMP